MPHLLKIGAQYVCPVEIFCIVPPEVVHVRPFVTLTTDVADLTPFEVSWAVAVITAVPAVSGVTNPALVTEATAGALEAHVTFLLSACVGLIVAVS